MHEGCLLLENSFGVLRVEHGLPERRRSGLVELVLLFVGNQGFVGSVVLIECQCGLLLLLLKPLKVLDRAARVQKSLLCLCSFDAARVQLGIRTVVLKELQLLGALGWQLLARHAPLLLEVPGWLLRRFRRLLSRLVRAILTVLELV